MDKSPPEEVEHVDNNNQEWHPQSTWDQRPTNLTLVVGQWKFYVHKDILEKSSHYFRGMFSIPMIEQSKDVISLDLENSRPEHLEVILKYFYTGDLILNLTPDTVLGIVLVADMLQIIPDNRSEFIDYMWKNMINLEYCMELMFLCFALNMKELYSDARRFCVAHFSEIRLTTSFVELSVEELHDYLSDENLVVEDEIHVVEAIHRWFQTNKTSVEPNDQEFKKIRANITNIVTSCVCVKDNSGAHSAIITQEIFRNEPLQRHNFQHLLAKRKQLVDFFMFRTFLLRTFGDNLVTDVLKIPLDSGEAVKVDEMPDFVRRSKLRMASALCTSGPYMFISGGTPEFGKQTWISEILKFDVSVPFGRWFVVGKLNEFRRSHAMVFLENKLYTFGGRGKIRATNSKLECLDLETGKWENLQPMPVHVVKPAVTVSNNTIFYICTEWKVYFYSLITKEWCGLNHQIDNTERLFKPPRALYVFKTDDTEIFAALSLFDYCIKIIMCSNGGAFESKRSYAIRSYFSYVSSVAVNGNLMLFVIDWKYDEYNTDLIPFLKIITFDPISLGSTDLPILQTTALAPPIFALSHLPTFEVRRADSM